MLSEEARLQAERKIKRLEAEKNLTESIRQKIKEENKKIQTLLERVRNSEDTAQNKITLLTRVQDEIILAGIADLENKAYAFQSNAEKLESEKIKLTNERLKAIDDKDRYSKAIKDVQTTIAQIQRTVKESEIEEENKRKKMEEDLEASLADIRQKIVAHEEEAKACEAETAELKVKVQEGKDKLAKIQSEYEKKAAEKEEEIKTEKEQLLEKLKVLENDANEIKVVRTELAESEQQNFNNKINLYLKQTKFPECTGSFESTARVINQCKEELFKAVARINESKSRKELYQKNVVVFEKNFLSLLGVNDQLKAEIEKVKKAKQPVRTRILELQAQIKAKKEQNASK